MKLSKKLIVTGLLFSSVLGSVNLGTVSAMAATTQEQSVENATKTMKVQYIVDSKTFLDSKAEKITDQIDFNKNDIDDSKKVLTQEGIKKIIIPTRYNLDTNYEHNFEITEGIVFVYLNSLNTNAGAGHATVNQSRNVTFIYSDGNKELKEFATTRNITTISSGLNIHVLPSDVPVIPGYLPVADQTFEVKNIDGKDTVKVQLTKSKKVNIKYTIDGKEQKFNDVKNIVELLANDNKVESTEIYAPKGYDLVPNQKFDIKTTTNADKTITNTVEVKLQKQKVVIEQDTIGLTFIDANGFKITDSKLPATVKTNKGSKKLSLKNVNLPAGYKFVDNKDVDITNGKSTIKIARAKVVNIKVVYIDKDTKKPVSSHKLSGTAGAAHKLDVPKGYKVVEGSSNVITFGKDEAVVNVVVEKVTPITNHKSTITTYPGSFVSLYNQKGQYIQNRGLGENSSWASDKTMVLDGVKYYRVSTNEWVKAEAVYEYTPMANKTITTTKGSFKKLYTTRGKAVGNRGLGANSSWLTDKAATINGETMYRVATNEWIKASDIK